METIRGVVLASVAFIASLLPGIGHCAEPVRVLLNWSPTSTYAPFYVAEDAGFYAAAGLSVSLDHLGQNTVSIDAVAKGEADIGVGSPEEVIAARARGLPVKAIAALFQRSPIVFVSPKEEGITRPDQISGLPVRVSSEMRPYLNAMLASSGVPADSWTPVTVPSDPALFRNGPAKVWGVYSNGMALRLKAMGVDFNVIYPEDYGVDSYGAVLFARDTLVEERRDVVRSFVQATIRGIERAIEDSDMAVAATMKRDPKLDSGQEQGRFVASIPLFHTGAAPLGSMTLAKWEGILALWSSAQQPGSLQARDLFAAQVLER